jgi:AraC-like DNA-binding protein
MSHSKPNIVSFSDPLGETLHLLRLTGTLYCRSELTAPWAIDLPVLDGCMMFHIVTAGQFWLEVEGEEPRQLRQGSLVLVPHGAGHIIRSEAGVKAEPLFDIPVEKVSDRYEIMRYGGGGDLTLLTCGVVQFDYSVAQQFTALLPRVLQIDTWEDDYDSWLHSTLRMISREARELRPGGETVITHLADILIIQALRSWIDSAADSGRGWLVALRDRQVGKALALLHRQPAENWTVALLAKEVGMSRSGFSARFSDLVGESVIHYLTKLRMQLARKQLQESSVPLAVLAERFGYQSEAAFCRAFKRVFAVSPASVRRSAKRLTK